MGYLHGARQRGSAALLFAGIAASLLFTAGCGGGSKPIAKVNGDVLSEKEFYQMTADATRVDPQRGTVGLQTVSQWISSTVMAQEAKRLKVYPTEKELDVRLDAFRRQATVAGSNLEEQLKMRGMTVETLKKDLLTALVQESVMFRGATVSDQELDQEWTKRKTMFVQPAQVKISQITVDNPTDLKKVQSDLASNAEFALVARTRSKDQFKDQGGVVPIQLPKRIQPGGPVAQEVVDAAFKLKPGQIGEPVKVGATWVLVRLEELIAEKQPNADDYKELMRAQLRQQKAQANGKLQENQQELMRAQQAAKVEINRPEYAAITSQLAGRGGPGGPAGPGGSPEGGPPPAPPGQ
jgi:parvulin-like peptidyl-prolyl isomerase